MSDRGGQGQAAGELARAQMGSPTTARSAQSMATTATSASFKSLPSACPTEEAEATVVRKEGVEVIYKGGDSYFGDMHNGLKHGRGTYKWKDSRNVYTGEWKAGVKQGCGRLQYGTGDCYDGEWHQGRMHGKGEYKYKDGSSYRGPFVNDRMHGEGQLTYADGSVFKGSWDAGVMHGVGLLIGRDGSKMKMEYDRGTAR